MKHTAIVHRRSVSSIKSIGLNTTSHIYIKARSTHWASFVARTVIFGVVN